MADTFLNWDTNFKKKYPFPGHIDIDITCGFIDCKLFYTRPHRTVYLPFIYYIKDYKFSVEACEY